MGVALSSHIMPLDADEAQMCEYLIESPLALFVCFTMMLHSGHIGKQVRNTSTDGNSTTVIYVAAVNRKKKSI